MTDFNTQGKLLFGKKDFTGAIAAFSQGLSSEQKNDKKEQVILLCNRSAAYLELADGKKALDDAEAAIALDDSFLRAYQRKAKALVQLGQLQEALDVVMTALLIDAENADLSKLMQEIEQKIATSSDEKKETSQVTISSQETTRYAKLTESLLTWIKGRGATFSPHVSIGDGAEDEHGYGRNAMRGMKVTKDVAANTVLITVPNHLMVSEDLAHHSCALVQVLDGLKIKLSNNQAYIACLLLEEKSKGDKSRMYHYLEALPTLEHYKAYLPVCFEDKHMKLLENTLTQAILAARKKEVGDDYKIICTAAPGFKDKFTFDQFLWARCVVLTRAFLVQAYGKMMEFIVPGADLMERHPPMVKGEVLPTAAKGRPYRNVNIKFNNDRGHLTVSASTFLLAGSVVQDTFGEACNSRLFANHGVVFDDNENNSAAFMLGSQAHMYVLTRDYTQSRTKEAFAFARMYVERGLKLFREREAKGEDVSSKSISLPELVEVDLKKNPRDPNSKALDHAVSIENELQALGMLASFASTHLRKFNGSIADDEKRLASLLSRKDEKEQKEAQAVEDSTGVALDVINEKYDVRVHRCLVARLGEKRVYQHYINLMDKVQHLVLLHQQQRKTELKKALKQFQQSTLIDSVYIKQEWARLLKD